MKLHSIEWNYLSILVSTINSRLPNDMGEPEATPPLTRHDDRCDLEESIFPGCPLAARSSDHLLFWMESSNIWHLG